MEFLSNLFFLVTSRESEGRPDLANSVDHHLQPSLPRQEKPIFIFRHEFATLPNERPLFSNLGPYHAALWPLLSDNEWIDWDDVLGMIHMPNGGVVAGPSLLCFRRLHAFQDYNMTMPSGADTAPHWRKYRESMWVHLRVPFPRGALPESRRVLFLKRPGPRSRALLNHGELVAVLEAHRFKVRSIIPDRHSLSLVASAVVRVSLLIGINSGAYNAVFLPTGCGVLQLAPQSSDDYLERINSWQVGFQRLGVHQYVYACRDLYTRDLSEVVSNAKGMAFAALGKNSPIVASPKTMLLLLNELAELLEVARDSGSESGIVSVQECLSWESNHSQTWSPYREHSPSESAHRP